VRHSFLPALLYVSPPFPLVHVLASLSDSTRHLSRKTSTSPWASTWHPCELATTSSSSSSPFITEIYSVTLGQAVATLSPTIMVAPLSSQSLSQLIAQLATMLTSYSPSRLPSRSLPPGHLLPLLRCHDPQAPNLPFFWRQWMHDFDPFTRLTPVSSRPSSTSCPPVASRRSSRYVLTVSIRSRSRSS
jgi:hypothetical protein